MAVNWPGLLAWSTKHHDGTKPSEFKPLSDEDRKFLETAMEEAFGQIEDPNKIMWEACQQIQAADRTEASIITALEVIDRCCDDVDVARNAEKLGAIQLMIDLVGSHQGQIQIRSLEILALLFSNNPLLQEAGMKRGAMPLFLEKIRSSPSGSEVRGKSFRTLAALIRKNTPFEEKFLREEGGLEVLLLCMGALETAQCREKATVFLTSLLDETKLQAAQVERLAAALVALLSAPELPEASIQYRESIAECALQLSREVLSLSPASVAAASLEAACKARSVQLEQLADKSEIEQELTSFKEAFKVFIDSKKK
eukprot:TRINITY_DN19875_c0_g4_i1.p1 TRINITY_DN19875_c0_g4~~TRINITY_DN19875_c0_g4_i1.p1  ORF type:complete len:312 (+),score=119.76 TRINITY_DN19875_c0_g4_i1:87-1022(+)